MQWQFSTGGASFVDIPGATSTTYSFTAAVADSGNVYRALFTNPGGSTATGTATLTVLPTSPPIVTLDPRAVTTVLTGQVIFLATTATGTPTPTAQWQVSSDNGAHWSNVPGATGPNLSFSAERWDNAHKFRVLYTNTFGSTPTSAGWLFVRLRVGTDLDNDRKTDLMVWRPGNGYWFWLTSSSSYDVASAGNRQWGNSSLGDVPLSGDLDGDGIMDLVVWRASTGTWFWLTSTSGYSYASQGQKQWGNASLDDQPMLGDQDGDGLVDLTVWRASTGTWFWLTSSSGYDHAASGTKQWGNATLGDQPLIGDMDGDGLSDLVVWRASSGTYFWLTSSSGYAYGSQGQKQWGNQSLGDIPMLADLDGDGMGDLVVWRNSSGTWFWLTSSTGYNVASQGQKQWGATGDIPMIK